MLDRDKWHEIWVVLARNPIRTLLTAFGVFWGIFMLMVMLGSGKGLQNGVKSDFGNTATNSIFLWTQRTKIPYKGMPAGRRFELNNDDVQVLKDKIPEISIIAPRCQLGGYGGSTSISRNNIAGNFNVMGDVPELLEINPKKIVKGRFLNKMDLIDKRKVAVIGTRVKQVLFAPGEEAIGEYVAVNGVYFKVIGIFDNVSEASSDEGDLETIYIPISSFQQAFNWGDVVGWLSICSKKNVRITDIEPQILKVLADRHQVSPDDSRAFGRWNMEKQFMKFQSIFTAINLLIWIVGTGTLLAGVIGITNIMLIVVKERTKEIGIRKAIGATPFSIVAQIVMETIILTALAGYSGMAAGVFLMEGLNKALIQFNIQSDMFANPEVDFEVAISATVVIIISGALAGLVPAQKAARINAVVALKSEG